MNASPARRARVEGYMHSKGMHQTLHQFKDNDCTRGLVTVKPQTKKESNLFITIKREVWKPKISLKWHHPYRTPLTL
jgi:hypothetical protein